MDFSLSLKIGVHLRLHSVSVPLPVSNSCGCHTSLLGSFGTHVLFSSIIVVVGNDNQVIPFEETRKL